MLINFKSFLAKQNYFIKGAGVVNLSQRPGKHHTFPFPQFPLGQGRGKEELKQENLQVIIKKLFKKWKDRENK